MRHWKVGGRSGHPDVSEEEGKKELLEKSHTQQW